jgi:hypothetical protein
MDKTSRLGHTDLIGCTHGGTLMTEFSEVISRQNLGEAIEKEQERFDRLSSRVAEAYAELPAEQGMAEVDAAIALDVEAQEVVPIQTCAGSGCL